METENQSTTITSFVLWGFSHNLPVNLFLFFVFLFIYVLTLLGNIVIMVVTSHLSSPMYFFLAHLAFLDICLSSVTVPKLLEILTKRQTISYSACLGQMFFILLTGSNEVCILAVMAFDRFAAICKPLHYVQIMKKACCRWLVGGAWTICFSYAFINTFFALKLSFCRVNFIKHFSCELPSLFALSCTDTLSNWILFFITGSVIVICSFSFILFSYVHIISTILKLNSAEAKRKTFSTCTAHLIVMVLYYSTGCFRYMRPSSASSIIVDELISIQYSISTPMLNPLIYSLKNREVKEAIKKLMGYKPLISHTV
ncbi:olfactory receptor 2D3-like [Pantherophis guttatus]|uniref:Olfactory receptor 2D3-like n=1 Tax=Pantherophis guttatus TaxID=94885 RepID=A0A6P9CHV7_PANGU|nr:olfactory receptor 2D3-like [Pantherophis guttatus]